MTEFSLQRTEVSSELGDASNVLVLAPSMNDESKGMCFDLLSEPDPSRTNALLTTFTKTPNDVMQDWATHVGTRPVNLKIVSVGETMRSAAATTTGAEPQLKTESPVIDTVSNIGDVTGLGIKLSQQLQAWDGNGNKTVGCIDSLVPLVQTVDLQTTFRFLHVLTGRFSAADARVHYHLDPNALDEQTVSTLKTLFDAAVERQDDSWSVKRN